MPGALNGTPPMDVFGIEDCHGSSLNAGLVSAVVIGLSNSLSFPLQVVSKHVPSPIDLRALEVSPRTGDRAGKVNEGHYHLP